MNTLQESLVAEALNTKEGRGLLWEKAIAPAAREFVDKIFSTWDGKHQRRFVAFLSGNVEDYMQNLP